MFSRTNSLPTRTSRTRRASTLLAGAATFAVASLVLVGCSASAEPADKSITFGVDVDPAGHLDPHSSQLDINAIVQRPVFDSLVYQNADGEISPWLATEWQISDDGLAYTFTLRDDVTFTDGEAFNADAVKANFDHIVAPETESASAASMLGGEFYAGTEVVDEYTVKVSFTQPFAPFLGNASEVQLGFYSPAVLTASADKLKAGGPDVSVGTGPLVLSEYTPGSELVYTANDDYAWAPEGVTEGNVEELIVKILPEASVRTSALTAGQVDFIADVPPSSLAQLEGKTIQSTQSPGVPYSLYLNGTRPALGDLKVRQAFAQSFDLDAAVKGVFGGGYDRAWSILGPTTPNAYDPSLEGESSFDQKAANALLEEAGWSERDAEGFRTKNGERLTVRWISYTPVSDDNAALANLIQDDVSEVGIELVHDVLEPAAYMEAYTPGDFDIADWGYLGTDGDVLRSHLGTGGFQNASHLSDAAVDALLASGVSTTDPAARETAYVSLQQWNADNLAIVPLYVPEYVLASSLPGDAPVDIHGWPLFAQLTLAD